MDLVEVKDGEISLTPGVWRENEEWRIRTDGGIKVVQAGDRVLVANGKVLSVYRQTWVEVR